MSNLCRQTINNRIKNRRWMQAFVDKINNLDLHIDLDEQLKDPAPSPFNAEEEWKSWGQRLGL